MEVCKSRLFIPFYIAFLLSIGIVLKHFELVEAQGPGGITDFEITPLDSENEFSLSFTYTKHETDPDEKPLRYYIYGANTLDDMENGNRDLFLQVNSPKEPGMKESFNLNIFDADDEQMYFQIIAISSNGDIVPSNKVEVNEIKLPSVESPQVLIREINSATFEANITVPLIKHANYDAKVSKFLIFGSDNKTVGVDSEFLVQLNNRKAPGDNNIVIVNVDVPTNSKLYYISVAPVYQKYRSEWDTHLIINRTEDLTTIQTTEETTVYYEADESDDTPWIKTTVGIITVCAGVAVVLAAVLALHLFIKNRKKKSFV